MKIILLFLELFVWIPKAFIASCNRAGDKSRDQEPLSSDLEGVTSFSLPFPYF